MVKAVKWLLLLVALLVGIEAIPDPYKVLGIERDANEQDIRAAFKRRSKKYHPDRNKTDPRAKEKFEKVVNAYELLKDPERKRIYDMTGDDNPQLNNQGGFHPGGGAFFQFPGGGFHGSGFPGGGGGINIEDLLGGFGGFFHPGQGQGQRQGQGQGQGQGQRAGRTTYTFHMGGGSQGFRFQF